MENRRHFDERMATMGLPAGSLPRAKRSRLPAPESVVTHRRLPIRGPLDKRVIIAYCMWYG